MEKFLRKHSETTLVALAIVFLVAVIAYFAWGIGVVVRETNRALSTKAEGSGGVGFDLRAAEALELRGLAKPTP